MAAASHSPRAGRAPLAWSAAVDLWRVGAVVLLLVRFGLPVLRGGRPSGPAWTALLTGTELWLLAGVVASSARSWLHRGTARALGRARTFAASAVVALIVVAHHVPALDLEPFSRWVMYTTPVASLTYHDLEVFAGETSLGPPPLDRVVEHSTARPVHSKLSALADRAADGDEDATTDLVTALEAVLRHGGWADADRVDVRRCTVDAPTRRDPARCAQILSVAVMPERR